MGYKQHNNPFSRKISSPLKHNVVSSEGKSWDHSHKNGKVTGRVRQGKIIRGSEDFMKEGAQNLPWEAEAYAKTDPFEKY